MISLKDLENNSIYIESNSMEEDMKILNFLTACGYKPVFDLDWYVAHRQLYAKMFFALTSNHLIYMNSDAGLTGYHLEYIDEYHRKIIHTILTLSVGDRVYIDTSKYPEIEGRIGEVKKIDNYKGKITYRVDVTGCNNDKSTDGLYLFDESQITKLETKAGKEAVLTVCNDIGYDAKEFDALCKANFNYKENKMELLEIYRDRKTEKLFEDADKAQSKAWEKNSTYKALKDLSEKTKTKDGYLFTFNFDTMPDSVREEIDKIQKDKEEKEIRLNRLIKEIEAQLKECETYEQKINVLKTYEILDEKGKVNA